MVMMFKICIKHTAMHIPATKARQTGILRRMGSLSYFNAIILNRQLKEFSIGLIVGKVHTRTRSTLKGKNLLLEEQIFSFKS